ncbi:MAG: hypothetical protein WAV41_02975 [Microgenomates group bacterium]
MADEKVKLLVHRGQWTWGPLGREPVWVGKEVGVEEAQRMMEEDRRSVQALNMPRVRLVNQPTATDCLSQDIGKK